MHNDDIVQEKKDVADSLKLDIVRHLKRQEHVSGAEQVRC